MEIKLTHTQGIDIVNVPESWDDVLFKDYIMFVRVQHENKDSPTDEYIASIIATLCKIDIELVYQLPVNAFELIWLTLRGFIDQLPKEKIPEKYQSFDVADIQWRKLIRAQQIMDDARKKVDEDDDEGLWLEMICSSADIAEALTGEDFKAQRTTDAFWCTGFFLPKLLNLMNNTGSTKKKKKTKTTLN